MSVNRRSAKQMRRFLNIDMDVYTEAGKVLSKNALSLWIIMLDNTKEWRFSAAELKQRAVLSDKQYTNAVKELRQYGLVSMHRSRKQGRFVYDYDVFDTPQVKMKESTPPGAPEGERWDDSEKPVLSDSENTNADIEVFSPGALNHGTVKGIVTSTNKQSIITSNKKQEAHFDQVGPIVPFNSKTQKSKSKQEVPKIDADLNEAVITAIEQRHPSKQYLIDIDKLALNDSLKKLEQHTDRVNARRLLKLAAAEMSVKPHITNPVRYLQSIVDDQINNHVTDVSEEAERVNQSGGHVSLSKQIGFKLDEDYYHQEDTYDIEQLEEALDNNSLFSEKQQLPPDPFVEPQNSERETIDDGSDLPF
ncbi:hypothetical protein [Furfurilactobacillus entadae]|uniref:hypothetical protein n=1 Tax=Furfurilactobacillus entadae TaxID=2922307 RepID=UPI0035E68540